MKQLNWQIVTGVGDTLEVVAKRLVGGKAYWKIQTAAALGFMRMSPEEQEELIQQAEIKRREYRRVMADSEGERPDGAAIEDEGELKPKRPRLSLSDLQKQRRGR